MSCSIALSTKMRFFQTIGVARPEPGILVFHLMFFSSLHSMGGFESGTVPFWVGPRQFGQVSLAAPRARGALRAMNANEMREFIRMKDECLSSW